MQMRRIFPMFSRLIAEIEFQIIHDIFCDHYFVQRKAFAFDEYTSLVYEKFVEHIIELRLEHWTVFIALLMFFWIPVKSRAYLIHCDASDKQCFNESSIVLLILIGESLCYFISLLL
jgi:hypothetical protein